MKTKHSSFLLRGCLCSENPWALADIFLSASRKVLDPCRQSPSKVFMVVRENKRKPDKFSPFQGLLWQEAVALDSTGPSVVAA